jgi:hypothetical protein
MYPIIGGENVDMWHDHMYVHYNIIIILATHLQQF